VPALLAGAAAAGAVVVGGCTDRGDGAVVVQPGAPGEPGRIIEDGVPRSREQPHTTADVLFMHGMIAHHAQALRMAGIALMEGWLERRGEAASGDHDHGSGRMPGMLTEEQFTRLEGTTGADFDRMFLELMIFHHEGAVIMVEELRSGGDGQEPEISRLLNHIDLDQRIEIDRMGNLLAGLQ
jgi:uncharacterized protein (DUF305 family)